MNINVSKLLQNGERIMGTKVNQLGGKTYVIGGVERGKVLREIQTDVLGNIAKKPVPTAEQVLVSLNLK